jgi:hypothetical protein
LAYQKVKHMTGVFTSVFAHTGHITKEESKEIDEYVKQFGDKLFM